MESGQDPSHFWRLTLREIRVILDGSVARLRRERNENIILAWHIEALARTKKLPKLETLLKAKTKRTGPMTPAQLEATVRGWLASRKSR